MRSIAILICSFCSMLLIGQGSVCADASPFCTGTAEIFPNTSNGTSAEIGPDYDCLGSEPNPAWYFLQVGEAGDINLTISQEDGFGFGLDVDFACWGPFAQLAGACDNLDANAVVDCSYSTAAVENCDIPNTQVGEFYILLITNFDGSPGTISFDQTSGDGATDCNVLNPITVDAGQNVSLCPGGSATIGGAPTASGGNSTFTYSWTPTAGLSDPNIANPVATPGVTTTYTVTVDDGSVSQTDQVTVEILASPNVQPGPNLELNCDNSELTINASGTAGTYSWTTVSGNIVSGANTLNPVIDAAGTYTLEIESGPGCLGSASMDVTMAIDLDAELTIDGPTSICQGENAEITFDLDQVGDYEIEYSIDGISQGTVSITDGNSYSFQASQGGVFEVIDVQNDLCTVTSLNNLTLEIEALPTLELPNDNILLCPGETEVVGAIVEGEGNLTFDYTIDGVAQGPFTESAGIFFIDVNMIGTYQGVSISSPNCIGTVDGLFSSQAVDPPVATFQGDYTICADEFAQVTLDFEGTQPFVYSYSVNGVDQGSYTIFSDQDVITLNTDALVTVTLLEDQNCAGAPSNTSMVDVNPVPDASLSGGGTFCMGTEVDFTIDLIGTAPFTIDYELNGIAQASLNSDELTTMFTSNSAGVFEIVGIADALCDDGAQNSVEVIHYPPISIVLDSPDELCVDDPISMTVIPTGGNGNSYVYEWLVNNEMYSENSVLLTAEEPLFVEVTVNDDCDIPDSETAFVDVQEYPEPALISQKDSICIGEAVIFERTSDDASMNCIWTIDNGDVFVGCDQITTAFGLAGYHGVTLSTSTSAGCETSINVDSLIYVERDAEVAFDFELLDGTIFSPHVQFENQSTYGADYLWLFGDDEISTEFSPRHTYPVAIADDYIACLQAFNLLGCLAEECQLVPIEPEYLVSTPNAFSPNGDGLNDLFLPRFNDIELAEYQLRIYDRNGLIVFETFDQFQAWNGQGRIDQEYYTADGVYIYEILSREFNVSEKRQFVGTVTVVR